MLLPSCFGLPQVYVLTAGEFGGYRATAGDSRAIALSLLKGVGRISSHIFASVAAVCRLLLRNYVKIWISCLPSRTGGYFLIRKYLVGIADT